MLVRGRRVRARSWRLLAVLLTLASAGCAGLPQQDIGPEPLDRFERVNRGIYRFNRGFDRNLARPIARGYDRVVPPRVQTSGGYDSKVHDPRGRMVYAKALFRF